MKIIAMTDIHGDLEVFDRALEYVKDSDADVLTISGDLAGRVLREGERKNFARANQGMRKSMNDLNKGNSTKVRTLHEAATYLSQEKEMSPLKQLAQQYLGCERLTEQRTLNQYQEFKKRFDELEQKVLIIPGNWDTKNIDEVLAHNNIHNKTKINIGEINFVGYGGAEMFPHEMPTDLVVKFDGRESFSHLAGYGDVDVALIHEAPAFFEGKGPLFPGDFSQLAFLYYTEPSLILYGHTHNPYARKDPKTDTVLLNPGNLGRYFKQSFGTFAELNIDEESNVDPKISLHALTPDSIKTQEVYLK